jgi:hypothetical protein
MSGVRRADRLIGMTLPPRWRKAALTVHIVTAVGWLGVDFVMLTLGIAGLAGADPDLIYPAQSLIGRVLFAPLSVLVWLVAVCAALLTPWGLLRHWWVVVKLLLTTLMLVLVVTALYPGLTEAGELAGALPRPARINLVVAPAVSTTLLLVATVLSTYKPWGRVRRTATPSRSRRSPAGAGPAAR